jgi:ribosome maturation protein SDO1
MNVHGKRFEIACYRNKLLNYRQGIETDLSEVLQTDRLFTNVSKGQFASSKDLQIAFGTSDQLKLCKLLLDKGEIQVSDVERASLLDNTSREVAAMVADKCVDAVTNRPFTLSQIRDAMKKAEFVVQPTATRSVKQQFLDCVKAIQNSKVLNIQRANMELAIIVHNGVDTILNSLLDALDNEAQATNVNISQEQAKQTRIQFQIQPHLYKAVESLVRSFEDTQQLTTSTNPSKQSPPKIARSENQSTESSSSSNPFTIRLEILQQVVLPNASSCDINLSVSDSMSRGIHAPQYPKQAEEITTPSHMDEALASLSLRDPINNEHQSTPSRVQKKNKKEKRREKEPDLEYQAFVAAQRQSRDERQVHPSNVESSSTLDQSESTMDLKSCNTCGGSFTLAQHRAHFKSDWHRYNVKLKLKGSTPIDEKEFSLVDADAFFFSQLE